MNNEVCELAEGTIDTHWGPLLTTLTVGLRGICFALGRTIRMLVRVIQEAR